ncbi:MAG: hypothetical protein JW795_13405 [Chitinivibrionales bacterium]|nr:hypothetical protein [Chitinivibrionales bacterium]
MFWPNSLFEVAGKKVFMNNQAMGILIGGLLPALLFGVIGLLQKSSQKAGISLGWYIIFISIGVLITGITLIVTEHHRQVTAKATIFAILIGLLWSVAMASVAIAISRFGVPVSKLVPLYNVNTLIAVILGFVVYMEWKEVNPVTLLIGALLIVIGGTLAANS